MCFQYCISPIVVDVVFSLDIKILVNEQNLVEKCLILGIVYIPFFFELRSLLCTLMTECVSEANLQHFAA